MTYEIKTFGFGNEVIFVAGVGSTKFFNDEDIQWLNNGGIPALNAQGYMILPFGHYAGKDIYPDLFDTSGKAADTKLDEVASSWDIDE